MDGFEDLSTVLSAVRGQEFTPTGYSGAPVKEKKCAPCRFRRGGHSGKATRTAPPYRITRRECFAGWPAYFGCRSIFSTSEMCVSSSAVNWRANSSRYTL